MKPYNERLPFIDAAIEYHKGKWPTDKAPYGEECLVLLDNGNYIVTMGIPGNDGYVCNRVQFEKRAKELGWINGYKWGVEYETKGKKPDLPDDVVIECFDGVEWWGGYDRIDNNYLTVDSLLFNSTVTEKFRIVDERYRPKLVIEFIADSIKIQTPNGVYEDVIDLINKGLNEMNNDWYEKGELPPVGTKCEYRKNPDEWLVGEIFGHRSDSQGNLSAYINLNDGKNWDYSSQVDKFRPLRTETDKLVEQMMFHGCQSLNRKEATELVEKGYRKIKPMSEYEFVQDVLKHFETKRFEVSQLKLICESLRKLHKAGCRFIDKGE